MTYVVFLQTVDLFRDSLTFECQVKCKPISGLYSLGPLNKGSLFSINAFWFMLGVLGNGLNNGQLKPINKSLQEHKCHFLYFPLSSIYYLV
ncbi:hypothetical protein DTO96_101031 [Ephemeroptericola cinctiostellae]|uniref:Uncharacterized protein n=1 Tax=Ephemeroptericola cinctiostellae TaxID=2268024 RepID=A0A345DAB3_9BURK|nr:hypothetical protein DTO96_101031 [Ephemeroptericola cinctiostellae]